jgi:RimJ/RimL family protein N-acetyltransferase
MRSPEKPWIDNYAILLRTSGRLEGEKPKMIGTVGAVRLPQAFEDAVEIAYGIYSDFWGNGYASEALGMFVELYWAAGRKILALYWYTNIMLIVLTGAGVDVKERLVAKIDPENKASGRVVQKAGFEKGEIVDGGYVRGGETGDGKKEQVWWVLECPVASGK